MNNNFVKKIEIGRLKWKIEILSLGRRKNCSFEKF